MFSFARGLVTDAVRWLLAPTRRKWVVTAAVVAAVLLLFTIFRHYRQEAREAVQERDVAQASVGVLEGAKRADDAALVKSEGAKRSLQEEEARYSVVTENALAANPDWAGQPVPLDVLVSLRDGSD